MIAEFFSNEYVLTILVSILCGSIVGLEREYKNKSAGFRTVILICFGATIFTMVSKLGKISDDRIAANIVTGIGFLGAGVIFQGKFSVQGLTTAAVIWTMAAIGMIVGFGEFQLGIGLAITMVIVLSVFQKIETIMSDVYLNKTLYITFVDDEVNNIAIFQEFLSECGVKYLRRGMEKENERVTIVFEVSGNRKKIRSMNEKIIELKYVYAFSNM